MTIKVVVKAIYIACGFVVFRINVNLQPILCRDCRIVIRFQSIDSGGRFPVLLADGYGSVLLDMYFRIIKYKNPDSWETVPPVCVIDTFPLSPTLTSEDE